jgi:hypothetical protein
MMANSEPIADHLRPAEIVVRDLLRRRRPLSAEFSLHWPSRNWQMKLVRASGGPERAPAITASRRRALIDSHAGK